MSNSLRAFLFPSYFPPLLPFQSRPLPPSLPPPPQTILHLFIFIVSVYFLSVIPPSLLPLIIFQYRFCFVHSVFLSALYFYPIFFSCFVFWLSFGSFPILSFYPPTYFLSFSSLPPSQFPPLLPPFHPSLLLHDFLFFLTCQPPPSLLLPTFHPQLLAHRSSSSSSSSTCLLLHAYFFLLFFFPLTSCIRPSSSCEILKRAGPLRIPLLWYRWSTHT